MKKLRLFCALFGLLLLFGFRAGSGLAAPIKEKTIASDRSKIQVKVLAGSASEPAQVFLRRR